MKDKRLCGSQELIVVGGDVVLDVMFMLITSLTISLTDVIIYV